MKSKYKNARKLFELANLEGLNVRQKIRLMHTELHKMTLRTTYYGGLHGYSYTPEENKALTEKIVDDFMNQVKQENNK